MSSANIPDDKLKVCYFGTYRAEYSRNQIMIEALRCSGVEVIECHEQLWKSIDDRIDLHQQGAAVPARDPEHGGNASFSPSRGTFAPLRGPAEGDQRQLHISLRCFLFQMQCATLPELLNRCIMTR